MSTQTAEQPQLKRKSGKAIGRRSIEATNRIREQAGLQPLHNPHKDTIIIKQRIVRPVGRPKKQPIVATTDKAKHQLFLSELLSDKSEQIIRKIIKKALDDDDKDQMVCMKMCVERVLPVSFFEKAKESQGKGVNITIMGVGNEPVVVSNAIDSVSQDDDSLLLEHDDEDSDA